MKSKLFSAILIAICVPFFCMALISTGKNVTVTGKVIDEGGDPIAGCSVILKDTPYGVTTNATGMYSIAAKMGQTLLFSFIGMENKEVVIKDSVINVTLKDMQEQLEEVVIVAFGQQKKNRIVGSSREQAMMFVRPSLSPNYDALQEEEYGRIIENTFKYAQDVPLSTFSIDVDAASYGNMRRMLNQGTIPPKDAVRTEELINYFSYNYAKPTGYDPVKIAVEASECPWKKEHKLVRIALKAKEIESDRLPASNFVFLIDVSGSMEGHNRLGLVKSSLKLLINNLRDKDRVAIVVYAGAAGEKLPSTPGNDRQKILSALDELEAGGSTAGGAGIELAYKIAQKNFIKDGNNRVILCTDGDFNVGVSSNEGLEQLIEQKRKSGVFLTVLGYGMGNYKDSKMQTLAEKGNGNHAYIDNLQEANKTLVQEFGSTMYAVAKDVKLQVEFNPAKVQAYRLIGYENRLLRDEDFNNDAIDAGEMGAGHCVTAFYEVVPVGVTFSGSGSVDSLKYQTKTAVTTSNSTDLLTVKMRYKNPDEDTSRKLEVSLTDINTTPSEDFRFAASVAMFGQILTGSSFKGDATCDKVIALAKSSSGKDEQGYRREFVRLVEAAKGLME
ncbi:MAG: von Willebrand factor type A domain-containing protein [Tannerella sp.]|jgi:Ca-activated chloride channel family protein|nr:von Willebrand factor type A domain-containing protein [Tannerella sp.]